MRVCMHARTRARVCVCVFPCPSFSFLVWRRSWKKCQIFSLYFSTEKQYFRHIETETTVTETHVAKKIDYYINEYLTKIKTKASYYCSMTPKPSWNVVCILPLWPWYTPSTWLIIASSEVRWVVRLSAMHWVLLSFRPRIRRGIRARRMGIGRR